jgi:hypothetical protein
MLAIPRIAAFLAMLLGVISIAGVLWREARRDQRRRRLVRHVESILRDEDFSLSGEKHLKRVA